jgi:isoleucyl-tRNA synthetase
LKVRQPLARAIVVSIDPENRELLKKSEALIAEELNVRAVELLEREEELVHLSAKANFKKLGGKLGPKMKLAASLITQLSSSDIADILSGKAYHLTVDAETAVDLNAEDIVVVRDEKPGICVAAGDGVTVALDTALDEALIQEGFAREVVSKIQNMRKEADMEVADHIKVTIACDDEIAAAVKAFNDYICNETLTDAIVLADNDAPETDVNGHNCRISIAGI